MNNGVTFGQDQANLIQMPQPNSMRGTNNSEIHLRDVPNAYNKYSDYDQQLNPDGPHLNQNRSQFNNPTHTTSISHNPNYNSQYNDNLGHRNTQNSYLVDGRHTGNYVNQSVVPHDINHDRLLTNNLNNQDMNQNVSYIPGEIRRSQLASNPFANNGDPFIERSVSHTRKSIFEDNRTNFAPVEAELIHSQRMGNVGLKEEVLKDQIEYLERENAERQRYLSKIDNIMMKSEAGGALGPYMDYITKLKEENTRLKVISQEREFLKEEQKVMGGEVAKIYQVELAFDMEVQDSELDDIKEATDRKYTIESTTSKNIDLQQEIDSMLEKKNGYLKILNGYDPESYLKLVLTDNEVLRERKKLLNDKISQINDHVRVLAEFSRKNEAEKSARMNDKEKLEQLFDEYKRQYIEEKVQTGEQSRAMIKALLEQEYQIIERKLRNEEEKNLALNHEYQRYYNFGGHENVAGGGFIDQDQLHYNRQEEIDIQRRIGDVARIQTMMGNSTAQDKGLQSQFAYDNRSGMAYNYQDPNMRYEGEKMAMPPRQSNIFDSNLQPNLVQSEFLNKNSTLPHGYNSNINNQGPIRMEGDLLANNIARSQLPQVIDPRLQSSQHPINNMNLDPRTLKTSNLNVEDQRNRDKVEIDPKFNYGRNFDTGFITPFNDNNKQNAAQDPVKKLEGEKMMHLNEYLYNMNNPDLDDAVKRQYMALYGKNNLVYDNLNPNNQDPIAKNGLSYTVINQHDQREFNPYNQQYYQNPYGQNPNDPRRTRIEGVDYYKSGQTLPSNVNYANVTGKSNLTTDQFVSQLGNPNLRLDGATGLKSQVYTSDPNSQLTPNMRIEQFDPNRFTSNYGQTKYLEQSGFERRYRDSAIGNVYVDPGFSHVHPTDNMAVSSIDIHTTKTIPRDTNKTVLLTQSGIRN